MARLDNKNADTSAINAKNLDNEGVICQLITKTFERNFLAHFNFLNCRFSFPLMLYSVCIDCHDRLKK